MCRDVYLSSCGHCVQWSETVCIILVESLIRNCWGKLFEIVPGVQEISFKDFSTSNFGVHFFSGEKLIGQFW